MNLILASSWSITASPRLMFADRNEGGVDNCDEIIMSHFLPYESEPCLFSLKWWRSGFGHNSGLIPQVQSACRPFVQYRNYSHQSNHRGAVCPQLFRPPPRPPSLPYPHLIPKTKKNIQSKLSAMRDKNCIAARVSNDAWTKPCSMIRL